MIQAKVLTVPLTIQLRMMLLVAGSSAVALPSQITVDVVPVLELEKVN
jgi:hypothetical protein